MEKEQEAKREIERIQNNPTYKNKDIVEDPMIAFK